MFISSTANTYDVRKISTLVVFTTSRDGGTPIVNGSIDLERTFLAGFTVFRSRLLSALLWDFTMA